MDLHVGFVTCLESPKSDGVLQTNGGGEGRGGEGGLYHYKIILKEDPENANANDNATENKSMKCLNRTRLSRTFIAVWLEVRL